MDMHSDPKQESISRGKRDIWMSTDQVKTYMHGSDAAVNPIAVINDETMHRVYAEYCPPGSRVLDVGCGHGITSMFLADRGCSVVSCDISQNMLNELDRTKGSRPIETRQGDAYNLPDRGDRFDAVVARHFLAHFPDWPAILKEMDRVLKPGGHIVIHFSSRENRELAEVLCRKDCQWSTYPDPRNPAANPGNFSADATENQIGAVAAKLGLRLLKVVPLHFFYENRLIGHSLGTEAYQVYMAQLRHQLQNPDVMRFVLWFEGNVVSRLPPGMTYPIMFALHKPA